MTKSIPHSLAMAAVLAIGCLAADAQQYSTAVALPGVPNITTYNSVPEGFDPAAASDTELQQFGFPKRPDISDTKAYGRWLQAVSVTRITPELVVNTGRYHRPNQRVGQSTVVENTTHSSSGNWSGWSLIGGSPVFDEVVGLWVVPNVGSSTSTTNGFMSEWVGIDGNCKCNDLIQDGTEQQFTGGKATYYAWIEFIPEAEVIVKNLTVAPGDVIYAYSAVAVQSGKIVGVYYLANYNTKKAVSATIAIPPKTTFSGLSAEWIVERTEVNGSFTNPLPNYAYAYMDDAWAYRSGSSHAIDYTAEANENIVMVQGTTQLSKSFEQDADSMWFQWLAYF
ncbi:G1 family endopeptidase [Telmatobacter sp. DSM 110680]|uniref:G1 family endopeptidase n=1 Tax=Telmatobacter sp. DSM 110680 TaxID=3036704 RepID=A0AAU7DJ42_9BACT